MATNPTKVTLESLEEKFSDGKGIQHLLEKYIDKYAKYHKYDKKTGKTVRWDERENKPFSNNRAIATINYWKYGTTTPQKDRLYLQKVEELNKLEERGRDKSLLSRIGNKQLIEGDTLRDRQHSESIARQRERLAILRKDTSFGRNETIRTDKALVSSGDKAIAKKLKEIDKATTKLKLDKGVFDPKNQPILDAAASFRHEDLSKYSKILGTPLFKGHASLDGSAFQVTEKGESNKNNLDFKTSLESEVSPTGAEVKDGEVKIPNKPKKESALIRAARRQSSSKGSVGRNLLRIQELRELSKLENENNDESEEET